MKKVIFILSFVTLFQLNSWSQSNEKISFDYNATELSSVIEDLDNRYEINFAHGNQPQLLAVNINAKGERLALEAGLDKIFKEQPVKYRIMGGQVVLRYEQPIPKLGSVELEYQEELAEELITQVPVTKEEKQQEVRVPVEDFDPIESQRPKLFRLKYNADVDDDHDDFHMHFRRDNDGPGGFEVYTSELFRYHLSFKSGNNHFYSMVNLSSNRVWPWRYKRSDPQWALGIGAGYKAEIFRVPFRAELILNHINEDRFISTRLNELVQVRTLIGLPFLGTEITFGPSFNLHVSGVLNEDTNQIGSNMLPGWEQSELSNDMGIYYWVGGTIGVLF